MIERTMFTPESSFFNYIEGKKERKSASDDWAQRPQYLHFYKYMDNGTHRYCHWPVSTYLIKIYQNDTMKPNFLEGEYQAASIFSSLHGTGLSILTTAEQFSSVSQGRTCREPGTLALICVDFNPFPHPSREREIDLGGVSPRSP